MTKPNFRGLSRKELRGYVLAHRDDDEAFYAYVDKIHEDNAAVKAVVLEWLRDSNPHKNITKVPEKYSGYVTIDPESHEIKGIAIQIMMYSLPQYQPLLNTIIEELIEKYNRTELNSFITVFVTTTETDAKQIDMELLDSNFDSRAESSRIVGYIDKEGKFQSI